MGRLLNHMEFVHRPGERPLVGELFDLLGIEMFDSMFVIGRIDADTATATDNIFAGSEARPEQMAFEAAFGAALAEGGLAAAHADYMKLLSDAPQYGMHVGIRFDSLDDWRGAVDAVAAVADTHPNLVGRVRLQGDIPPGHPASLSPHLHQAFLWTDVIACGSLTLGQQLELQYADLDAFAAR